MLILHQWHQVTAYGDTAIIERAKKMALYDYINALTQVANGIHPINNIDDAIEYIEVFTERGIVRDEIQRNEIVCDE